MPVYHPELTLRDARTLYFELNAFGDGGYNDNWVKSYIGPLPFYFPNTKARAEVVRYHDLHHILTGYETDWSGETQISAWEIATGCTRNYAAWILNLLGFAMGLGFNPKRVYKAFLRGRRSFNLYARPFNDELLESKVGKMRRSLRLDGQTRAVSFADRAAFFKWAAISAATYIAAITLSLAPFVLLGVIIFRLVRG